MHSGKSKNARKGLRALFLAGAAAVALGIGGVGATSAVAAPSCAGSNIAGIGASLQDKAHNVTWIPGFAAICTSGPTVTYAGPGSGSGISAWNFNGTTSFDTTKAFTASDDAPTATQINNAQTSAGGAKVLIIPVTQTSIAAVVNPPPGCSLKEITNKQLENAFRGNVKVWEKFDNSTGAGCQGFPVTRVVRSGTGSGTTYQFKNYLNLANSAKLACTEAPGKSWKDLLPIGTGSTPGPGNPNITWPENSVGGCKANQLSPIVRHTLTSNTGVVTKVNETEGAIGYSSLADIELTKTGDTRALKLQNNGLVKNANAQFATPVEESTASANCASARYTVPVGARKGESGESIDWSQVFGADLNIAKTSENPEAYPLCTLTFAMALKGYSLKAGFTEGQVTTVRDYLTEYITTAAGQEAIEFGESWYSALPTGGPVSSDVLEAAKLAASKISF